MLENIWEELATTLANATDGDDLVKLYNTLMAARVRSPQYHHESGAEAPANVVFARDTRASGSRLVECLTDAFKATNVNFTDYKLATTPQLHYYVRCINTKGSQEEYGDATEAGYYSKLSGAFKNIMEGVKPQGTVTVDCANGVGGPKLRELMKYIPLPREGGLKIKVVNDDVHKPDMLNVEVGLTFRPCPTHRG